MLSRLMHHTAQPTPTCSETCHGTPTPPLGSVLRCTPSHTCPNWACSPTQLCAVPSFLTQLHAAPTQSPVHWVTLNPPHLPSLRAVPSSRWGHCPFGGQGWWGACLIHLAWGRVAEDVGDERRGTRIDEPKCTCLEFVMCTWVYLLKPCCSQFTHSGVHIQHTSCLSPLSPSPLQPMISHHFHGWWGSWLPYSPISHGPAKVGRSWILFPVWWVGRRGFGILPWGCSGSVSGCLQVPEHFPERFRYQWHSSKAPDGLNALWSQDCF